MTYDISNYDLLVEMLKNIPEGDGCLEWPRGRNQYNYGQVQTWDPDRERLAHRQAWIEEFGPIPEGLFVCHRCDLFDGTAYPPMFA